MFRFFDFYDFVTANYFEGTNRYFIGASQYAPWFGLATAKAAAERQMSHACEGGKHQFVKQTHYTSAGGGQTEKTIMLGLPHVKVWPTIELRTTVKAIGISQQLQFYQTGTRPLPYIPAGNHNLVLLLIDDRLSKTAWK